jgi:hypothetical protein
LLITDHMDGWRNTKTFRNAIVFHHLKCVLVVIVLKHVIFQLSLFLKFCFGLVICRRFLYFILQLTLSCFKK